MGVGGVLRSTSLGGTSRVECRDEVGDGRILLSSNSEGGIGMPCLSLRTVAGGFVRLGDPSIRINESSPLFDS